MFHSTNHFMLCWNGYKLNNFCCSRAQMCLLTSAWRNYFLYRKLFQEVLEVCTKQQKHLETQCPWSPCYLFYFVFSCFLQSDSEHIYCTSEQSLEFIPLKCMVEGPQFLTQNTQFNATNITMQQHFPYFPGLFVSYFSNDGGQLII